MLRQSHLYITKRCGFAQVLAQLFAVSCGTYHPDGSVFRFGTKAFFHSLYVELVELTRARVDILFKPSFSCGQRSWAHMQQTVRWMLRGFIFSDAAPRRCRP
jgi:hypothetical protein